MKKMGRFLSLALATAMTMSMVAGCGDKAKDDNNANNNASNTENAGTEAANNGTEKSVTLTLGIWPEDTLTDDIAVHEGYVEKMAELHPEVECVPSYYKYSTDTFMPLVESGNCPTIFETWFTEPQKLIKAGAVADITDELEERG